MLEKIVFMGTPEFSVPILENLLNNNYKISAVYSQPASKANRGQKINPSAIEILSKKQSLNLRTPTTLNNDLEFNFLKNLKPDIVIVAAYGKIIPKKFLSLAKYGFINVHASLLPKWRGAAPIQRSIMNLDKETGISIMKIVEELDSGPVMFQKKVNIDESMSSSNLSSILSKSASGIIKEILDKIENKQATFFPQDHSKATYAKKILKAEGKINWNESARRILAKINGLNPNPGAWFEYKNERYKVWRGNIVNIREKAGKIIDDKFTISCGEQSIRIVEIQKEGKSKQLASQFLLGNKFIKGEDLI